MAAATSPDWKAEARDLRAQGMSERDIASALGKSPSTIHGAVKDLPVAGTVDSDDAARYADAASGEPIPGQIDIDGGEADAIAEFKEEAGEPVGPMPPRDRPAENLPPPEDLRVDGTTQLGLFNAGGKKPQTATLKLAGGKIALVDGRAFRKGDTIQFEATAVVREVAQRDKPDAQTGIVVSAEQRHVAYITDLRILADDD